MIGNWLPFLHSHLLALFQLPLASLISLDTLRSALSTLGYPAVALFIMIESAGIPFPGETMLVLASFYAAVDHTLQIPLVIACAAFGAIIGDNIGYLIGRTGGYALVQRFGRYVFLKPEHLQKAQSFFVKHGNKTVFFGRFIAILRAWAAFLAGVNRMNAWRFFIYTAGGAIIWSTTFGVLGYELGRNLSRLETVLKALGTFGVIIFIVLAVLLVGTIWYRTHRGTAKDPASESTAQPAPLTAGATAKPAGSENAPTTPTPAFPANGHPATTAAEGSLAPIAPPLPEKNAT
jgi:membrane protein DedA with SNARE-associated domain